jgi:hypothetical protein
MTNTNSADANGVGRKDVYTKVTERSSATWSKASARG